MFKLDKLQIDSYKNLSGNYEFCNKGYIALIGLNGSGKSNLLEAICIIFDGLVNKKGAGISFDYEIEYEINSHIFTKKKRQVKKDGNVCKTDELVFPTSVIACYSGEDRRLWLNAFESYYMNYFNNAVKRSYSSPTFLYVDKHCWEIALISLICSNNPDVKKFLKDLLNIEDPANVELDLTFDDKKKKNFQTHAALRWFDHITQNFHSSINLKTISTTDIFIDGKLVSENEKSKHIFNFLYLLSQPKKKGQNKIDKLIEKIKVSININDKKIDFIDLSEGEKKLILVECITKVLGDENSLILLDEPDAHTHIAMKEELLKLISEFDGQIIMTTHSPMFLNKRWDGFKENNIFYMHDGKIEDTEPLTHLAELTNNEIDYFEGSFILSSKNILVTEGPYDILYIKHAIEKLAIENPKYIKLREQVAFMHAGGANNATALYKQTLYPVINKMNKIVFIFDYDKEGYEGAEGIKNIMSSNGDNKTVLMFYQDNYSTKKTRKPTDKDSESYMVEDLFHSDSYKSVINKIYVSTHKELRNMSWNDVLISNKRPKGAIDAIKYYIQDNYSSFEKAWLLNFKPVLNELLKVFDMQ